MRLKFSLFFAATLLIACQCDVYYSNSNLTSIKGALFDIKCKLVKDEANKVNRLEVSLNFRDVAGFAVDKQSVKIFPILNKRDTLNLSSNYASQYMYEFSPAESIRYLDLVVSYNLKSSGMVTNKRETYEKLHKREECRYRPVLH